MKRGFTILLHLLMPPLHLSQRHAVSEAQARQAEKRTLDAEAEARTQKATAEQLAREAHATLERERVEVDRLRSELTTTRAKSEQLANISDELRTQLLQIQVAQSENQAS